MQGKARVRGDRLGRNLAPCGIGFCLLLLVLVGAFSPQAGRAQEGSSGADAGANAAPIDTSITVQPSRRAKRSGTPAGAPALVGAYRPPPRPPAAAAATSNAVGLPTGGRAANSPAGQPLPVEPPLGASGAIGHAAPARPVASAVTTPPAVNHAAVSGTGMQRPGSGPGVVRGSGQPRTGINGTGMRSRY